MPELLRRCAVLAATLKNDELKNWALLELNGYPKDAELPDYRTIPAHAVGHLAGPFGSSYQGITIPASLLPEKSRDFARIVRFRQAIAELATLATSDETKGYITCPWPGDLVGFMQDKFGHDLVLYGAWQFLSKASIAGLVDSVRNRVLEFVMQLDQETPEPKEGGPAVPGERVHQLVQTIIYGNVIGDVIAGVGGSVTQVKANDLESLKAALTAMGVPAADVETLESAVAEDDKASQGMGAKTTQWLGTVGGKVGAGAITLAKGVSVSLIAKAILIYFGVH